MSFFDVIGASDLGSLLRTFVFILLVGPYFTGLDFGLIKIPRFTEMTVKRLKILGPVAFVLTLVLSFPIYPNFFAGLPTPTSVNGAAQVTAVPTPPSDTRITPQAVTTSTPVPPPAAEPAPLTALFFGRFADLSSTFLAGLFGIIVAGLLTLYKRRRDAAETDD